MKKLIYLFGIVMGLFACQQNEQDGKEKQPEGKVESRFSLSDMQDAAELSMESMEQYESMSDEVKEMRRAGIAMAPYVSLDTINKRYTIDISEEEAFKLGIGRKDYQRVVSEIETANKLAMEHPELGNSMIDIKKQYKEYKKKLDSGKLLEEIENSKKKAHVVPMTHME